MPLNNLTFFSSLLTSRPFLLLNTSLYLYLYKIFIDTNKSSDNFIDSGQIYFILLTIHIYN